jgi:hypothetical protein
VQSGKSITPQLSGRWILAMWRQELHPHPTDASQIDSGNHGHFHLKIPLKSIFQTRIFCDTAFRDNR